MYRRPSKNRARDYKVRYRQAQRGDDLLPPPDRRLRPIRLCQKGECRWLKIQCLRPAGPCAQVVVPNTEAGDGQDCGTHKYSRAKGTFEPCSYLRKPCNRQLQNCPFNHCTMWRCEECGDWVLIGNIHFVHDCLKETKHRFIARTQKDASAICGGCLERLRQHHKDDPRSWLKGIGQLRAKSLYGI